MIRLEPLEPFKLKPYPILTLNIHKFKVPIQNWKPKALNLSSKPRKSYPKVRFFLFRLTSRWQILASMSHNLTLHGPKLTQIGIQQGSNQGAKRA